MERDFGKVGKERTQMETFDPEAYQFIPSLKDLFKIQVLYEILREFDLELPNLMCS